MSRPWALGHPPSLRPGPGLMSQDTPTDPLRANGRQGTSRAWAPGPNTLWFSASLAKPAPKEAKVVVLDNFTGGHQPDLPFPQPHSLGLKMNVSLWLTSSLPGFPDLLVQQCRPPQ